MYLSSIPFRYTIAPPGTVNRLSIFPERTIKTKNDKHLLKSTIGSLSEISHESFLQSKRRKERTLKYKKKRLTYKLEPLFNFLPLESSMIFLVSSPSTGSIFFSLFLYLGKNSKSVTNFVCNGRMDSKEEKNQERDEVGVERKECYLDDKPRRKNRTRKRKWPWWEVKGEAIGKPRPYRFLGERIEVPVSSTSYPTNPAVLTFFFLRFLLHFLPSLFLLFLVRKAYKTLDFTGSGSLISSYPSFSFSSSLGLFCSLDFTVRCIRRHHCFSWVTEREGRKSRTKLNPVINEAELQAETSDLAGISYTFVCSFSSSERTFGKRSRLSAKYCTELSAPKRNKERVRKKKTKET